jgi:hypothetical protein
MEMQNQVAEMEIEVEVWQAMAQQVQQPRYREIQA